MVSIPRHQRVQLLRRIVYFLVSLFEIFCDEKIENWGHARESELKLKSVSLGESEEPRAAVQVRFPVRCSVRCTVFPEHGATLDP